MLARSQVTASALERVLAPANARRRSLARNALLDALEPSERESLAPRLTAVDLAAGARLLSVDDDVLTAFFPAGAVVGLLVPTREGATVAVEFVGSEGLVGAEAWRPYPAAVADAVVLVSGPALTLSVDAVRAEPAIDGIVAGLALRRTNVVSREHTQAAACSAAHRVERRLCRVLLALHDRLPSDEVPLTQDLLGALLGVSRRSVSAVANDLEEARILVQAYGHIRIANRGMLEAAACECYQVVRRYARAAGFHR